MDQLAWMWMLKYAMRVRMTMKTWSQSTLDMVHWILLMPNIIIVCKWIISPFFIVSMWSAIFSIITFVIYVIIPELNGTSTVCRIFFPVYLFCLTLCFSAISLAWTQSIKPLPFDPCSLCGFLVFYTSLAAALSLNVISFDFWMKFGSVIGRFSFLFICFFLFNWTIYFLYGLHSLNYFADKIQKEYLKSSRNSRKFGMVKRSFVTWFMSLCCHHCQQSFGYRLLWTKEWAKVYVVFQVRIHWHLIFIEMNAF